MTTLFCLLSRSYRWVALFLACFLVACTAAQPGGPNRTSSAVVEQASSASSLPIPPPPPQARLEPPPPQAPVAAEPRLGTQWGESRESKSTTVHARRLRTEPDDVAAISYNDAAGVAQSTGYNPDRQLDMLLAKGDLQWAVLDEQGRKLPLLRARGTNGGFYITGLVGERYVLAFDNLSNRDYVVVTTVDGLNVLSGEPGDVNGAGYVVEAHDTMRITGFRKSNSEVATFRFAAKDRAYAGNTPAGDSKNIGIIGTAVFEMEYLDKKDRKNKQPDGPNSFPNNSKSPQYAPPPRY